MTTRCPFCGCDPYHYVDNGVGMEAVAVTCCDTGTYYFSRETTEPELDELVQKLLRLLDIRDFADEQIGELRAKAEEIFG